MAITVPNVANHLPIHSSKSRSIRRRGLITRTFQPVCCTRLEEHGQPKQYQISNGGKDIWKLFEQAQHNILYMNNQRMRAQEELEKVRRENQLLLQMMEGIEINKQVDSRKVDGGKDKLSTCWKLLLRIDSLVLTGLIGAEEASELRSLAMGTKAGVESFISHLEKNDTELLAELRHLSEQSKENGFHIVHICTEMDPVVSVGSLASYVTGLSRALQRKSHLVEVILPKYKSLDLSVVQGLREIQAEFFSYFDGRLQGNKILTGVVNGIGVTFIQPLHYSSYFEREKVYGYPDDFERFSYFSRASLDYIVKSGKRPDVIHIHNWHTSFVGPLFWDIFVNQGLGSTRIMLTCQDLNSQCHEKPDKLYLCGLDAASLHRPDRLQDHRKSHLVNILKGGIVYSNAVLVSSMESKVSIMKNLSHGLESTLATHKDKLYIAPIGLENSTWNPSEDSLLPVKFSASDMRGKTACKVALQQHTGFPELSSSILVGCLFSQVSKVDLEYLVEVIRSAAVEGVQFIFVGVSKMAGFNRALKSLEEELKGQNVRFMDEYNEAFSHLILGGSDIILCQSFDNPVLQVPIKAMKYGAAPIAIASIDKRFRHDNDSGSTQLAQFIESTFAHMSLLHAIDEIRNKPVQWNEKIVFAMKQDFAWDGESYEVHASAYAKIRKM